MAGHKNDIGKSRIDLIPPQAILEVAGVLTDGVDEYGAHNWREGIVYSRIYSAIQRHLLAFWKGDDIDKSGHRALAHACTDIMMLMEMPKEWDDRYIKPNRGIELTEAKDHNNGQFMKDCTSDNQFLFVDSRPTGRI